MMRLVYAYLLVGLSLSSALHAEPPTNPELGRPDTLYVLEIFTASECVACANLHRDFIASFTESPLSKTLRLRIRTVPPVSDGEDLDPLTISSFCAQATPEWFSSYEPHEVAAAVEGLSSAGLRRFRRCIDDPRAQAVMRFNRSEQLLFGFQATPAFRLLKDGQPLCDTCAWQGFRSTDSLTKRVDRLLSSVE